MPLEREEMFGGEGSVDPYSLYPKEKFIPILDGDTIKTQGAHLKVFHTPGHANDHIVLMLEEENAMFTADNVLGIGTTVFRDLKTYMNSLRVMAAMSPARLYPGHGPVVENGSSKIAEYIDHRLTRIKATISVLGKQPPDDAEAWTLESLTRTMYSEIPEHLVWPAMVNTLLVLTALRQDGIVTTVFSPSETAADVHHIVPSRSWQLSLSEEKAHALVADLSSKM
jgi:endoribonuclease LACTB2